MQILTTTEARKKLAKIINLVSESSRPVAIGRRDKADVLLIKFPQDINPLVDEMTNMNQYGGAFDFLAKEPDLYAISDLKKRYV